MKNTKGLSRTVYYSLAVGVVLLSIRPLAAGENLTPPELATTVMTEALLGNGNFLAAKAGTDAMHPLHFSTIVDQFGQSFSYEASGQYNGQQLSISGTGTVTTGGKWILNSRTQLGASQWSVPGTLALTPLSAHGGRYDLNTSQSIVDPNATGGGTWTDVGIIVCCGPAPSPPSKDDLKCCGQQYPSTDFTSIDPSAGTWDVSDTWVSGSVVIHADTPILGGDGVAVMTIAPPVCNNLLSNGSFETGDFTGWTEGGNFEFTQVVTGPFYVYPGAEDGNYYATLGPVASDGTLSQTFATTPGANYTFSFWFASVGDDPSDFSASWDGTSVLSLTNPNTGVNWTEFSFTETGTGSDTISFSFRDDPGDMALDHVSVCRQ